LHNPTIPARLSILDTLIRADHFYIAKDDQCYFLWEWVLAPYAENPTTNLIGNLQKEPRFEETGAWRYKIEAIAWAAKAIGQVIPSSWVESVICADPAIQNKVGRSTRHEAIGCSKGSVTVSSRCARTCSSTREYRVAAKRNIAARTRAKLDDQ
jgi:hypothetical protein